MAPQRLLDRLLALDGTLHLVLDALYESEEAALAAAKNWCNGQGLKCSISQRSIGVEVMTRSGSCRTVGYPRN